MSPHAWQRTTLVQHSHCTYCGGTFPADAGWPRICPGCGETSWLNPLPVAIILMPVRQADGSLGVVVVRRAIEPQRGKLALPGGFVEVGETWQEAAVRELREETGLIGDAGTVELYHVESAPTTINIIGLVPPVAAAELPASAPTDEATEWLVLSEPCTLAFPTHTTAVARYFASA